MVLVWSVQLARGDGTPHGRSQRVARIHSLTRFLDLGAAVRCEQYKTLMPRARGPRRSPEGRLDSRDRQRDY